MGDQWKMSEVVFSYYKISLPVMTKHAYITLIKIGK